MCTACQRKLINGEIDVLTFVETERENSSVRRKLEGKEEGNACSKRGTMSPQMS